MSTNVSVLVSLDRLPLGKRVAANLRAEMARYGLHQAELASAMGLTQQAISQKLSGKRAITLDEIELMAPLVGMTPEELISGNRKPRPDGPDGGSKLLQLDSNQQPFDYQSVQVTASDAEVIPLRFGRQAPAAARWIQDPVAA